MPVTSIGNTAFAGYSNFTSIVIPNSITSIGMSTFVNCLRLTSINIPDGVTTIGSSVFYGCSSLTGIVIPDSVTTIGRDAFYNCTSLVSVVIPDSVTSIAVSAFRDCNNLTIYCEAASQPSGWNTLWNIDNRPVIWGVALSIVDINNQLIELDSNLTTVTEELPNLINMTSVTYFELKSLRDNSQLIPGMFYRITDYVCTTSQENTRAMDNKFDIIVQALSANTLSETASADYHYENGEPDGYFEQAASSNVTNYYTIIEDETGETSTNEGYERDDIFIDYGYAENIDGDTVPVLYKTDMGVYPNEADYEDVFYYTGTYELDGVIYDKWRKIDSEYTWENTTKRYDLTNVVVENNVFINDIMNDGKKVANLPAWELKYCLDNDTTKFAWVSGDQPTFICLYDDQPFYTGCKLKRCPEMDNKQNQNYPYAWGMEDSDTDTRGYIWTETEELASNIGVYWHRYSGASGEWQENTIENSGDFELLYTNKGVIYYMKDEHGNECPYDFKNIQFKRDTAWQEEHTSFIEDSLCLSVGDVEWFYTFSWVNENLEVEDLTMRQDLVNDEGTTNGTHHNIISIKTSYIDGELGGIKLSDNVFINTYQYDGGMYYGCYYNTFGNDCYNNTFANSYNDNIFGNNCYSNTFGNDYDNNTFGNDCDNNVFGSGCNNNTFGNSCSSNTFANSCNNNIFGNNCYSNTFGNDCSHNIFGDNCYNNKMQVNNVQYVYVLSGINGKTLTPVPNANYQQIYKSSGTQEIILD